jgi:hypothetical protein
VKVGSNKDNHGKQSVSVVVVEIFGAVEQIVFLVVVIGTFAGVLRDLIDVIRPARAATHVPTKLVERPIFPHLSSGVVLCRKTYAGVRLWSKIPRSVTKEKP